MKKWFKALTAAALAVITACTAAGVSAYAAETTAAVTEAQTTFTCVEDVDKAIQQVYTENAHELYLTANADSSLDVGEAHFTYYCSSCGAMSRAFQKVLADHHIYVEERKQNVNTPLHAYNLMRVSFDGGNSVTNIVIDPTYKQLLRDYFRAQCQSQSEKDKDAEIDAAIDAAIKDGVLPRVLVYEFGNKQALQDKFSALNRRMKDKGFSGFDVSDKLYMYESRRYPETELQAIYDRVQLTPEQITEIPSIGRLNKPYSGDLFLTDANGQKFLMRYEENGVYTCLLTRDMLKACTGAFTVCGEHNKNLYGAGNIATLTPYYIRDFSQFTYKEEAFLAKGSAKPFTIICSDSYMLVRIDMRAGIDAPMIALLPVDPADAGGHTYTFRISGCFNPLSFEV